MLIGAATVTVAMPYILDAHKLAYFPVPKVACTSLKHMLHRIETGAEFQPHEDERGKPVTLHKLHPSLAFEDHDKAAIADHYRFVLVRDPVKRVLSAYSNRVVFHKDLMKPRTRPKVEEAGLPLKPDLDTFIENFEAYCEHAGPIRHHARPLTWFLGTDPSYYSRIYRFSELGQLRDDICTRTGHDVVIPHKQSGGPKIGADTLSAAQIDKIRAFYAQDYEHFGHWLD